MDQRTIRKIMWYMEIILFPLAFGFMIFCLITKQYQQEGIWTAVVVFVAYFSLTFFMPQQHYLKFARISLSGKKGFVLSNTKQREILWSEIKQAKLSDKVLDLELYDGNKVKIAVTLTGFKDMILAMPKSLAGDAWQTIRDRFEEDEPYDDIYCSICGFDAMEPDETGEEICDVCKNKPWSKKMGVTKEAYLRRKGADFFALKYSDEKVDFHPLLQDNDQQENWEPLVTEAEVLERSKYTWKVIDPSACSLCPTCGYMAVAPGFKECRACGTTIWEKDFEETCEEYLKQSQLDHFATENPQEKVDFFGQHHYYSRGIGWSPVVTENEVLNYSREEYWD